MFCARGRALIEREIRLDWIGMAWHDGMVKFLIQTYICSWDTLPGN